MARAVHGEDVAAAHGALPTDDPRLDPARRALAQLARHADLPTPPLWLQDSQELNAFTFGFTPYDSVVGVTSGLLACLSPAEVRAVLAHEVGHIRGDHIAQTTAVATRLAQRQGLLAGLHLASALVVVADTFADTFADDAVFLGLTVARATAAKHARNKLREQNFRFEYEADAHAAAAGCAPWLRSALRRMSLAAPAPSLPAWGRLGHIYSYLPTETHPPVAARTAAVAPDIADWFQQRECTGCLAPVDPGASACGACGELIPMAPCAHCGTKLARHHAWCTSCGRRVRSRCARCGDADHGGPFCTGCGLSQPTP